MSHPQHGESRDRGAVSDDIPFDDRDGSPQCGSRHGAELSGAAKARLSVDHFEDHIVHEVMVDVRG
jgi:hypothetical protein